MIYNGPGSIQYLKSNLGETSSLNNGVRLIISNKPAITANILKIILFVLYKSNKINVKSKKNRGINMPPISNTY